MTGVADVRDTEMEVFEHVIGRLVGGGGKNTPALELAVFEMLPQVREARRVLKNVVDVTGMRREKELRWAGGRSGFGVEGAERGGNGTTAAVVVGAWKWSPEVVRVEEERVKARIGELKEGLTRQLDELVRARERLEKRGR